MGAEQEEEMINGNQPPNRHLSPTPITPPQFLAWKRQKDEDAASKRAEEARKREEDIRAGRVQMNGRELFIHEPGLLKIHGPKHINKPTSTNNLDRTKAVPTDGVQA